ncbi:MAG TPA: phage tail protein, partial [Morganella sp. (in: Bacteria)]|nr:phage tail protein [Morganella sp. (in: enterobacteria)]
MSVINKPDFKIFAQDAKSGEVETFPDVLRGWGVTQERTAGKPPMEWFNSLGKRVDEWLMYLTQRGLPEWDASVDYPKDALIQHAGVYYVALKVSKGEQPNNSQTSWKKMSDFLGVDGKLTKSENGADIPDKPKFIENLGLPELLNKKFDKTGGTITATAKALEIKTKADTSGYIQISDENGAAIHQLGKTTSGSKLILRNVIEDATLAVGSKGVEFNG